MKTLMSGWGALGRKVYWPNGMLTSVDAWENDAGLRCFGGGMMLYPGWSMEQLSNLYIHSVYMCYL